MTSLLPSTSGTFEISIEASRAAGWQEINGAVPFITSAKLSPPPSFLPFLVWEYGLGMLTPYVPNLYDLIYEGVRWFRIRGTYAGVAKGLGFIGVTAALEPAWHGRAWWNSSQLRFPVLPATDTPLLERIEAITRLSLPFRSDLRRGVHQYDVPPAEADGTLLDGSHLDCESGIRISEGGTVWSFGRTTEIEHTLTQLEGLAIGNWLPVVSGAGLAWSEMNFPWSTATFSWADDSVALRRAALATWFNNRALYLALMDADGDVIGYRRVKSAHAVAPAFDGIFSFGGQRYTKSAAGEVAYVEAMTDFGDVDGIEARSVCLIANLMIGRAVPPGRLWLRPDEVELPQSMNIGRLWMGATGFPSFAKANVTIPLRKTVRERFKFLVRF